MKQPASYLSTGVSTVRYLSKKGLVLAAVASLLMGQQVQGAAPTWNNAGTDWNTGTDWTPTGVPAAASVATFNVAETKQPNISVSTSVGEVSFSAIGASGYDITSSNTGITLTLTGATAIAASNTSGTNTFDAPIVLGAASSAQAITQATGGTLVINGVVSQSGAPSGVTLSATGTGIIKLTGANTFTANTTISGTGAVSVSSIGSSGANGNLGAGTAINLGSTTTGGILDYTGAGETTTKTINLNGTTGGGTIDTTGAAAGLVVSNFSVTGVGAKTLTLQGNTTGNQFNGNIVDSSSGATAVTKAGSGTWTLGGTSDTYSGLTTVSGGTLQLGSGVGLTSGNALTTSGTGIFDLNGNGQTLGLLTNGGTVTNSNSTATTLTIGNGSTGAGSFTGKMNVIWNQTSSSTTITGTFTNSGNITLNDNSVSNTMGISTAGNTGTITNSGTGTGTTTISGIIGSTVTGVIQNSAGSQLVLSGANTYSGGLTIDQGTVVANVSNATTVSGAGGPSANAITLGSSTGGSASLLAGGNITVSNPINLATSAVGTLTIGDTSTASTLPTISGGIVLNGNNLTFAGIGTSSVQQTGIISGSGNLNINGTTSTLLGGANTFTGSVNLIAGTLNLRVPLALGNAGNALNIAAGTILDTSASNLALTDTPVVTVAGNFTYGATQSLTTGGTLVLPTGNTTVTLGSAASAAGRVLTLGTTSLGGNTLTVQSPITAVSTTINTLVLGATTLTGNEIFNVTNAASSQDELELGTLNDGGSGYTITKNGSGILYLASSTSTNTMSGAITVNAGVLGFLGDAASTNLGTSTVSLANGTGFGRLNSTGGTSSTLSNAVTIAPGATVSLFNADSSSSLGFGGAFTVGSGATIDEQNPTTTSDSALTISGPTTLGGSLTLNATQNSLSLTGQIVNATSTTGDGITIASTAAGRFVTLNNSGSTFDGGVTLTSGGLALGNSSTLAGSTVTQGSAGIGTLTLNGGSIGFTGASTTAATSINNTLSINGTVEFGGSTPNGLSNSAMNFGGAVAIAGGSVLTSPSSTTANSISFNSSAISLSTVTLGGNISIDPSGAAKFTIDDAIGDGGSGYGITVGSGTSTGTVVLYTNTGNPNTYSGPTTVQSGTLDLQYASVLQNSTLTTTSTAGTTQFDDTQPGATNAFTFGGLAGSGNLSLDDTGSAAVALTVGNNNTSTSYSGALSDTVTPGGSLTKIGTGTLTLSGTNTYHGPTTISGGNLQVTGSVSNSAVTVGNGTATVAILSGTGTVGSLITSTTGSNIAYLAPGVNISGARTDFGTAGTLQVVGALTIGTGTALDFDLATATTVGGGVNDLISIGGGLTLGTSTTFNFNALGTLTTGSAYTLINGATSITGFNASDFTTTGIGSLTATYSTVGGALDVTFNASGGTPTVAYYNGQGTDLNTAGNYDTAVSGNSAVGSAPAGTTNVYFSANRNTLISPNLSAPLAVNSVNFGVGSGTDSGITVSSSNTSDTLTVEASNVNGNSGNNGISIATGGGNDTISAPVVLGASQTWTPTDAGSTLTVSGQVSGTGSALTTAGAGAVVLSNPTGNTYTGGTTVSSGTLYVNNTSGSGTGTGAVAVSSGGTLAGSGNISTSSGVTVSGGGTLYSGPKQTSAPAVTGPGLTFTSTSVSVSGTSLAPAVLKFALGTDTTSAFVTSNGPAYNFASPSLNSTYLTLASGSTLNFAGVDSISLVDETTNATLTLRQGNPYLLVAAAAGDSAYSGLITVSGTGPTATYSIDGNGYVLGVLTSTGDLLPTSGLLSSVVSGDYTTISINQFGPDGVTPLGTGAYSANQVYAAPALYLYNGDLEVVPEPGTWALMLGGLALLVVIQRRRSKLS